MLLETDRQNFLLDENGQIVVRNGNFVFATGLVGIAQAIRFLTNMFQEEWFLNLDVGMPWRQQILGEKFSLARTTAAFRKVILSVPGVVAITSLLVDFDDRSRVMTVSWIASTQFGDTPIDTLQRTIR